MGLEEKEEHGKLKIVPNKIKNTFYNQVETIEIIIILDSSISKKSKVLQI